MLNNAAECPQPEHSSVEPEVVAMVQVTVETFNDILRECGGPRLHSHDNYELNEIVFFWEGSQFLLADEASRTCWVNWELYKEVTGKYVQSL